MKVQLQSEQENHKLLTLAFDTSSGGDCSEECTITTPDGYTVSIIKGKKKKESLLSSLIKKAISYAENVMKLIKLVFLLILLLLPDIP